MKTESEKEDLLEKSNLKRIDRRYISHEIEHVLHLDRGFFYTVKELFLRPGKAVREFLFEDRKKLVKPVLFLILCSVIFTIIDHLLHANTSLFNIDRITVLQGKIRSKEIGAWINNSLGYSQLIMGVFIAIWLKISFKKQQYNIYETVVLLSYILGQALLIMTFTIILADLLDNAVIALLGVSSYFIYIIWGIGQFFGEKNIINYVKSALTFALGIFSYLSFFIGIAYLLKIFFPETPTL
jgi:hypothetical protein